VTTYVPLRPVTQKAADTSTQQKKTQGQGGGGGGGGGGGRGGGGGGGGGGGRGGGGRGGFAGMMGQDEQSGSTRILDIVPEGSRVKAGEIVAKLDSSAFDDEEQAQYIRWLQAKSYVEQANAILEVNKISLEEYRDGIFGQDVQLVKQYIQTCELDRDRLARTLDWSTGLYKKGLRTQFQWHSDELGVQQAQIALNEATGMLARLINQTGPKIIKTLEANVKAVQADKFMQDAAYALETQRLERIRKNIKNCTVRAPSDGVVVYFNQTNRFGMVTQPIDQGVTLRQDQPIFSLPDPSHMRVKARINETKLSFVQTGQQAQIIVDAYPKQPLRGVVAEVTAINTPVNGSDVRVYFANVNISDSFADLRPGLSAQVTFRIASHREVTRVPLRSVRWVEGKAFVALQDRTAADAGKSPWRWHEIELGLTDSQYAEVVTGLSPGDQIVALPSGLESPTPASRPAETVAGLDPATSGRD
jgi:HlyD family secretion protein